MTGYTIRALLRCLLLAIVPFTSSSAATSATSCEEKLCSGLKYAAPFCDFECQDQQLVNHNLVGQTLRVLSIDYNDSTARIEGFIFCSGLHLNLGDQLFLLPVSPTSKRSCCILNSDLCSCQPCNSSCYQQECSAFNITFFPNGNGIQFSALVGWDKEAPPAVPPSPVLSANANTTCLNKCCSKNKLDECPEGCRCKHSRKSVYYIAGAAGAGFAIFALLGLACALRRKKAVRRKFSSYRAPIVSDFGGGTGPTSFTLRALKAATKNFSESRLLGGGGFSTVYQGKLLDGRSVAVKKLNQGNKQAIQQFQNEVDILSKVKHANLVQLLGYCLEGREVLLVYEYLPNGTLADHLHRQDDDPRAQAAYVLPLETRVRIAMETAKALAYLHFYCSPPIYHRDVKSNNILLDSDFRVKVADFGLSRLTVLDATHISTAPQGTPGYLDPDYHESYQLTDKSDVYSFGVLLLELVSGQKAVDMSRDKKEINLASMALARIHSGALHELFDPVLPVKHWKLLSRLVEVAFRCIASDKDDRPNMLEVVASLEQVHTLLLSASSGCCSTKMDDAAALRPVPDRACKKKHSRRLNEQQESPTSVQIKWPSTHTSPNNSKSEM